MTDVALPPEHPEDQMRGDFLSARAQAPGQSAIRDLDGLLPTPASAAPQAQGQSKSAPGAAEAAAPDAPPASAETAAASDPDLPLGRQVEQSVTMTDRMREAAAAIEPDYDGPSVRGMASSTLRGMASLFDRVSGKHPAGNPLTPLDEDEVGALALFAGAGDLKGLRGAKLKPGAAAGEKAATAEEGALPNGSAEVSRPPEVVQAMKVDAGRGEMPRIPEGPFSKTSTSEIAEMTGNHDLAIPGWEGWAFQSLDDVSVKRLEALPDKEKVAELDKAMADTARRGIYLQALPDDMRVSQLANGEWTPASAMPDDAAVERAQALYINSKGYRSIPTDEFNSMFDQQWVKAQTKNSVSSAPLQMPAAANDAPAYSFAGAAPGAELKVTPEIRAQATDYLNGRTGDNPVQASLSRIADPKVMQEAIEGVASFLPKAEVKPDEVLRRAAYMTAMQPEDVLAGLKGRLPNDEQVAAWTMLVNSGAKELGTLAQKAVETGAPEDWEAAVRGFALQNQVLSEWTTAGTEQARAFRARQLASEARSDYAATVQEIIKNIGPQAAEDAIRKIAALKTPEQISGTTAALRWMTSRDGLLYGWYNFLLGPKTVVKKALTDITMPVWNIAQRYAAETMGSGGVAEGETLQLIQGYAGAFGDALRAGGKGLMEGRSTFMADSNTLEGLKRTRTSMLANGVELGGEGAAAEQPTRSALAYLRAAMPTSWIAGIDDAAKTFHYRAELRALSSREASGAGLVGEEHGAAVNGMLHNPPQDLHFQAAARAKELTFTDPLTGVAEKLADVVDSLNIPVAGTRFEIPAGRMVAPFVRTPANFVKFMYRSSPLPLVFPSAAFKEAIAAGGASRDLAYAQIGLGTGLAVAASALAIGGYITGRGPSDPKLRQAWMGAGNQPYSIQIPGQRPVSYPLEPFAMSIGAYADTVEMMKFARDEDADQLALSFVLGTGHAFLSRTYMSNAAEFMDAVQNPDRSGGRYVDRLAASMAVPRTVGDVAGAVDPWLRAHYGLRDAVEARLPFVSGDLPFKRDGWGDPIPLRDAYMPLLTGTGAAHVLSPVELGVPADQVNPIDKWRWEHRGDFAGGNPAVAPLSRTQAWQAGAGVKANVRLTPEQFDRLQELAGNGLKDPRSGLGAKDTMNVLVQGEGPRGLQREWNQGSDAEKALMMQRVVSEYRGAAREALRREFPDVDAAVRAQWSSRAEQLKPGRPQQSAPGAASAAPAALPAAPASAGAPTQPRLE